MTLPHIPYAAQTNPTMSELDDTFAAVAALGTVPCTATGTNTLTLTPNANAPTISAYANYLRFAFVAVATSTGSVQALVNGLGTLEVFLPSGAQGGTGDIALGTYYEIVYVSTLNSGAGGFVIVSATTPAFPATGTWTPVLFGSGTAGSNTYATQTGKYSVVGNQVTAYFNISLSAASGMVGSARISGLPFSAITTIGFAGSLTLIGGITFTTNYVGILPVISQAFGATNIIAFEQWGTAQGNTELPVAGISNTTSIWGFVNYLTA